MTRYVRSAHLEVESTTGDSITLVHGQLGYCLLLNPPTQRFLELFREPLSLADLARMGPIEKALPTFHKLRRASFLIEEGHQESISDRRLRRVTPGFLNCPSARFSAARRDVTFLGVPFDFGNTMQPGARYGPAALRRVSQASFCSYLIETKAAEPRGWYDNDNAEPILDGVFLADAGDLFIVPNEAPSTIFGKLQEAVAEILEEGSFPVVLGGDHSITYPVLAAFEKPVAVIQIDAHPDLADYLAGEQHHHGNFMSRTMGLPQVTEVYQVGLRGTTVSAQGRINGKVALALTPRGLREMGIEAFAAALPSGSSYYVTFDIDSLDPTFAPGTSTPVPGGLTFEEAKALLIAIGSGRRCVGFDLVEVNPQRDINDHTAIVAIELLLAFLGGHFRRAGRCA